MSPLSSLGLLLISLGLASSQLLTPNSHRLKPSQLVNFANDLKAESGDDVEIEGVKGKSGYVKINGKTGSSMFYWLTECLNGDIEKDSRPLILWLQGGPGCSSMTGNLYEFGPLYIDEKAQPKRRAVTWAEDYHLIFIDNPIGAGFSFAASDSDYVTNFTQMSSNLYYMLTQLNQRYPTLFKRDFYIFGESYAGHWIPAIAYKILTENKIAKITGKFVVPLKGIGIGDGWTDPLEQLNNNAVFGFATGLTDEAETAQVAGYEKKGRELIKKDRQCEAQEYFGKVVDALAVGGGGVNVYNFREFGDYDFSAIDTWLSQTSTKDLLHVPNQVPFNDCNDVAYVKLCTDFMTSVKPLIPSILDQIPVLLFNGQDDLIVNTPAAENWIASMNWSGRDEYLAADKTIWKVDGEVAGYVRTAKNLTQLVILKAGHMAPADQPKNSFDMVKRFINKSGWE